MVLNVWGFFHEFATTLLECGRICTCGDERGGDQSESNAGSEGPHAAFTLLRRRPSVNALLRRL